MTMSYADGMAALHLEMPGRIPRTEYSAERHWPLVRAVTGLTVDDHSSPAAQSLASEAFIRAWNYDLVWSTLIGRSALDAMRTDMGHAVYEAGGGDFRGQLHSPFQDPADVLAFDPWQVYGAQDSAKLTAAFEAHYGEQCRRYPEAVNMTGIYITLFSGLIEIFGWEMLLLGAGTDPAGFGRVADRYASWIQQYFDALADADVPVVMVHDDIVWTSGPMLHPDWYRQFVFPNYKKLLQPLRESGKKILFTSDGTYTMFVDDIAAAGVHGFVLEPTTDMQYIADTYGQTHIIVGNADTRILLSGTKDEIRAEVARCLDIGRDCPGFFLAVGNHIPANTPVENALYYNEVYESLSRR